LLTRDFRSNRGDTTAALVALMFTTHQTHCQGEMQTGDLVFFRQARLIYHVGILPEGWQVCPLGLQRRRDGELAEPALYHRNFYAADRVRRCRRYR
jgi:hypothetical protein